MFGYFIASQGQGDTHGTISCSYGAISCFNGEDNLYSSGMASFIVAWPDCFVYDDRVNDINWAGITY